MARPRQHPPGTTGTDRKRLLRQRVREEGGRVLSITIDAEAAACLDAARQPGESDSSVIARALAAVGDPQRGRP